MTETRVIKAKQVFYDLNTGLLRVLGGEVLTTTVYLEIHQICAEITLHGEISIEPIDECNDELEIIIQEDGRACIYGANMQELCERISREDGV